MTFPRCKSLLKWPPIINDSSVQTAIVIAFAKHGCLTVDEISALLDLERTHITKRLAKMRTIGIATSFAWGGNNFLKGGTKPPNWISRTRMWMLDRRYPVYKKVRALGRALAKSFPPPGTIQGTYRTFRRTRDLDPFPSQPNLYCLGNSRRGRILMILARGRGLPIHTLAKLLGCSRDAYGSIEGLVTFGVLQKKWADNDLREHVIMLNAQFPGYWGLVYLAWAIDRATGNEFRSLSRARRAEVNYKRLSKINARRAKRRSEGKPYFLIPHRLNGRRPV